MAWHWIKDDGFPPNSKEYPDWSEPVLIYGKDGVSKYTYALDRKYGYDPDKNIFTPRWKSYESNGEYAEDYDLDEVYAWFDLPNAPEE